MRLERIEVPSPLGPIDVIFHNDKVVGVDFSDRQPRLRHLLERRFLSVEIRDAAALAPGMARVRDALKRYFAGHTDALDTIEVDLDGTPFQLRVWRQLRRIRPGDTSSYGDLARRLGRPRAARAVGSANGSNPVSLIVPCHRAIGGDGSLTGYAGGLERKRWLLDHEGALR